MRLIFMGSGGFAVASFKALIESRHEVAALVTQPDKPAGRGHKLRMPPTKPLALEQSIPVHQPRSVREAATERMIREVASECIVVVAYGQIIPKTILDIPPKGIINVHGSLLPAYRGAAPIQWSIARGERQTGVTTMLMDEGMDTGPILLMRKIPIAPDDTGGSLEAKMAPLGAKLLLETLEGWEAGRIEPRPQDASRATRAPLIKRHHARIDWELRAEEIACRVRAFIPWPVAFAELEGAPVKVYRAEAVSPGGGRPGETLWVDTESIGVGCGGGTCLRLIEVQAEGKRRMPAGTFARGRRITKGTRWR